MLSEVHESISVSIHLGYADAMNNTLGNFSGIIISFFFKLVPYIGRKFNRKNRVNSYAKQSFCRWGFFIKRFEKVDADTGKSVRRISVIYGFFRTKTEKRNN